MKRQLVFIHGGESFNTYEEYIAYLKGEDVDPFRQEEKRWHRRFPEVLGDEWEVIRPTMPSRANAKYMEWSIWFEKFLPFMRNRVTMVGHSLGANFLALYLSEHTLPITIKDLHLVAGCAGEADFSFPEDGANIERQAEAIHLYHSRNDPVVAFSDMEKYAALMPTAERVEFRDRGHFLGEEFPELIERIQA